jgi:hypothetical protein
MNRNEETDVISQGFMNGWDNCKRKILMHIGREIEVLDRWNHNGHLNEQLLALKLIEHYIEDHFDITGGMP